MSQSYTVLAASVKKTLPDTGKGAKQVIKLTLKDSANTTQQAEWFTNAETSLPAEGANLQGLLEPGKFGMNFRPVQSGGGGGYRDASPYQKPKTPDESARVTRQHSQEMALLLLAQTDTFKGWDVGNVDREFKKAAMDLIQGITDWFQRDVERGVQISTYGQQQPTPKDTERTGQSDVPAAAPGEFEPPKGVPTEEVPF